MTKIEAAPITNASEVIERFGGIRPMAKKIDVAVTTIQGWKKRDVIPAARSGDILAAAALHNVDLSGLIEGAPPVNQNAQSGILQGQGAQVAKEKADTLSIPTSLKSEATKPAKEPKITIIHKMSPAAWVNLVLAFIAIVALGALLFPQKIDVSQDAPPAAEQKSGQSFLGPLIPENLDAQIAELKEQAVAAQEKIGEAVEKAQEISSDVLGEDAGTLEQRYAKLEQHMAEIAATPELQAMAARVQSWGIQPMGQQRLDSASAEIAGMIAALGSTITKDGTFEAALQTVRENNLAVNQTFEGVPQEDLKAAALLLGMSQFRSSLGRDNTPFNNDLQVLTGLVGEDAPELKASLERLAPYAEKGVLTPAGLTTELKEITGEAVVASLKGEDVTISERAKAKFNEVFQVQKNGELVSGTDTQARMDKAQKLMESGDIEGAMAQVQNLEGPAAVVAAPWLDQAQASLIAQRAQEVLNQAVTAANNSVASGRLIHNEETGINIMSGAAGGPSVRGPAIKDANGFDDQ
jgi:hypothetical protein